MSPVWFRGTLTDVFVSGPSHLLGWSGLGFQLSMTTTMLCVQTAERASKYKLGSGGSPEDLRSKVAVPGSLKVARLFDLSCAAQKTSLHHSAAQTTQPTYAHLKQKQKPRHPGFPCGPPPWY